MSLRLVALLALALLAAALPGCGDDDSPGSGDVPSGAVAKVGDAEISREELNGQVEALARAQRGAGAPAKADGGPDAGSADDQAAKQMREQIERQALSGLVLESALEQEAAARGIEVTDAELHQQWASLKAQYPTKAALRRYLRGNSKQDVLDQLQVQLLTQRIQADVKDEAGGGRKGDQAVRRFQAEFTTRWQERTACAKGYTAIACDDASK